MKYKIFQGQEAPPVDAEPEVTLRLVRNESGSVDVKAICGDTREYYLLTFLTNGKAERVGCVPDDIGFQVDESDRIIVINS